MVQTLPLHYNKPSICSVVARGCLPPGANVFVAALTPAVRSLFDIPMVTTMAFVWTVNSTLSWGCNYVMQWNLGWSVATATAKKQTAAHTSGTCLCWNKVMYITLYAESVLQCKRQFATNGQISEFHIFAPPNSAPCTVPPRVNAPLPAATAFVHKIGTATQRLCIFGLYGAIQMLLLLLLLL